MAHGCKTEGMDAERYKDLAIVISEAISFVHCIEAESIADLVAELTARERAGEPPGLPAPYDDFTRAEVMRLWRFRNELANLRHE